MVVVFSFLNVCLFNVNYSVSKCLILLSLKTSRESIFGA